MTGTVPGMQAYLQVPAELADGLRAAGLEPGEPGDPTVIATGAVAATWPDALEQLTDVYRAARSAATAEAAVVFVVSADALVGRLGAAEAMAANGIVSAARTLAAELRKAGVPVNCLAVTPDTPFGTIATWAERLLGGGSDDPTGELIQLAGAQIGRALS